MYAILIITIVLLFMSTKLWVLSCILVSVEVYGPIVGSSNSTNNIDCWIIWNCISWVAIANHADCYFGLSALKLRCKSYERPK